MDQGHGGRSGLTALTGMVLVAMLGGAAPACSSGDDSSAGPSGDDDASYDRIIYVDPPDGGADSTQSGDGLLPTAVVPTTSMAFTSVPCGGPSMMQMLSVMNGGPGTLLVSASATGTGFSVSPATLKLTANASAQLSVMAAVPASAGVGTTLSGALTLVTNDPAQSMITLPISAVASGATLAIKQGPTSFAFPPVVPGSPATQTLTLWNGGTGPATYSLGAPSDAHFSLSGAGPMAMTLQPGESWDVTATFTPSDTSPVTAMSSVTATGTLCAGGLTSISYLGQGATGQLMGWPSAIDFGPVDCGGAEPPFQRVTLTNTSPADAHYTRADLTGAPGFRTDLKVGNTVLGLGSDVFKVFAPAIPKNSPVTPLVATLTVETDQDSSVHTITLTEEPNGGIVALDTTPTPTLGTFGSVPLLRSATQPFNIVNTGTAPVNVTVTAAADGAADAGVGDGGSSPSPFSVSVAHFSIPGQGGVQADSATFTPQSGVGVTGTLSFSAVGPVCGSLPAPVALSGLGLGGAPSVAPTFLQFGATCGGSAPGSQGFLVQNNGTANLTWSMTAPAGPGASQYTVSASPPPGVLVPGAASLVSVTAAGIASPAPSPAPSAYAAQLSVTTDVPLDPVHVVSLQEVPLGDQLTWSLVSPVRFGQVPVGSPFTQTFVLTNAANVGSSDARLSFALTGGGAAAYSISPASLLALGAGGQSVHETITFTPTDSTSFPASLAIQSPDSPCTPLPAPVSVSGTGSQGKVSLSATTLSFGSDPADPAGLVNCGGTGLPRTFTVSNSGNQAFEITGLTLGHGASSPFTLSGSGATLPATVPIAGSVSITVTPGAIPQTVASPSDASPFTDTLTLTTDAGGDMPHAVKLVMQARGAVIADTPLATSWTFGTVSFGSAGTFTSSLRNTGNAGVTVALTGVAQPKVFTLATNPTHAPGGGVTSIVGEFVPAAANASWSDRGTLLVTPDQGLCEPLPAAWNSPTIDLSGTSSSGSAVTASGSLAFPVTDCGSAAPAAQGVTLTNDTNVDYALSLSFGSGKFYTSQPAAGASAGTLKAFGTAVVLVTPNQVAPGPGVVAGSAPYADDLLVTIATSPPTQLTFPISWTLNGAVLSLPQGAGPSTDPSGNAYYPADSTSGFSLPMANSGTATANVTFGVAPPDAFAIAPAPPVAVLPGIGASPQVSATSSDGACPALTKGSVSFFYSGPVCQPFALPSVTVEGCSGTL